MDEMYVGGKPRLADKRQWANASSRKSAAARWVDDKKTPVFGMVERAGKVAAYVVPSIQASTLTPHFQRHVQPGSTLYTDEGKTYRGLRKAGGTHHQIKHNERVYVSGDVHTQTIDGFWSLVKRGISGTHHAVSPKWLQGYLNEYVWRYNHRDDPRAMFALLLLRAARPTL